MKSIKKIVSILISTVLILSVFACINVSALGAVISFNKSEFLVNEEVVATVTVTADENMQALEFKLNYDSSVLQFLSGDSSSGGAGLVNVVHPVANSQKVKLTYRFKALKTGSSSIAMEDSRYVNFDLETKPVPPQGGKVNVKTNETTLSSNANLKSLRLGAGTLNPAFSPDVTTYNALIPNSATKCLVYAYTADPNATLVVEGSSEMKIGANKRVVIVTAPDGTQKSYTLNITRSETPDEDTTSETESTTSTSSLMTFLGTSEYIVASDISSVNIFKGFKLSTAKYNGVDVSITTDENGIYKIYYLKSPNSEELVPCLLDNETNTFEKLKYVTLGENTYIFADFPEDKTVPSDYYTISGKVFDYTLDCYSSSDTKYTDFYYVYCYVNDKFGVYRYDSKENTLQRYPELVLLDDASNNENVKDNIFSKFDSLKTNAKIMVISLLVAILLALALIVLIIIKLFNKNNYDDLEDFEEEDFEEVSFDDNFLLESDEEDDEDN